MKVLVAKKIWNDFEYYTEVYAYLEQDQPLVNLTVKLGEGPHAHVFDLRGEEHNANHHYVTLKRMTEEAEVYYTDVKDIE